MRTKGIEVSGKNKRKNNETKYKIRITTNKYVRIPQKQRGRW